MPHYLKTLLNDAELRKNFSSIIISACAVAASCANLSPQFFDYAWIAVICCGFPIIREACKSLFVERQIKADALVSLALIASIAIGEIFAAAEIALIMQIGELLEELTVAKARLGLEKLIRLTPVTARVIKGTEEKTVPAHLVVKGDRLKILPGETIPVDGVITCGSTSIDQSAMTGESIPVDKNAGDQVLSGTINCFSAFEMLAEKTGDDSSIQRMIKLVQNADANKAKIVAFADRCAAKIVIAALMTAIITWFVTGEISRAVTILVVFCPCSLVLATPTAIMAAIGNA